MNQVSKQKGDEMSAIMFYPVSIYQILPGKLLKIILLTLVFICSLHSQVITEVNIEMNDGTIIDASIIKPLVPPPSNGYPGIILVHGFGGSKNDMIPLALTIATYGYSSIAYSVRGQGNSGGLSTVNGPREIEDLSEVIQYFRSVQDIDSTSLGVAGGSQGGIHSWMAATHQMPGIKAVVALIATPDFAKALVPNGCVAYGLPYELSLNSVNYSQDRDRARNFIINDFYDSLLIFIEERDLAALTKNVRIPVYQGLGWADFLFPVNGGIDARENLSNRGIPIWSYFGTNGHGEPVDTSQASFIIATAVSWFDHWLRGFPLDEDSTALVFYADDRPGWPTHVTSNWPPEPSNHLRLYVTPSGLLTSTPEDTASFTFSVQYDSGYSAQMGWDDLYGGEQFFTAFVNYPVMLLSTPLENQLEITGTPEGFITVTSDGEKFQANVRFYDVYENGDVVMQKLISRSVNGVRENSPGMIHEINIEGHALSHIITAGHRIGIELTSLDMLDSMQANTVPYFVSSNSYLLTSPNSPSYFDIPYVGNLPQFVSNEHAENPDGFTLYQNYPNPFNPTTKISWQSSVGSWQTLTIYDVLGNEVATLVDEYKPAGSYNVNFNASELASGIYFYKLDSGSFSLTKKMILMK